MGKDNHNYAQQVNRDFSKGEAKIYQFPPLYSFALLSDKETSKLGQITPENRKKIIDEGFNQGFERGIKEGADKGFKEGEEKGYQAGYQAGQSTGYEQGFSLGKKEGHAQALKEGAALYKQASEPFDKWVEQLKSYYQELEKQRREELLLLVEKVTKQVIRCELSLQPTQLLALVEEALKGLGEPPKKLKVLLNPEEYKRIKDIDPDGVIRLALVADNSIGQGECRVMTETSEMDVGCQHRLDQCMEGLRQSLITENDDD